MLAFLAKLLNHWNASRRDPSLPDRSQSELQLLYDKAPIGMCLVDRQLRYVRINQWLADINGLPIQEHLGKTIGEMLPSLVDVVAPYYERVFTTGDAIIDAEFSGKTPAHDEERNWLVSYHPLMAKDGNVWAVSSIVQDITLRKRYQESLEYANHRIRDVLESITDGFMSFDSQWRCCYVNQTAATMFHFTGETMLGRSAWEIFSKDREPIFYEKLEQARRSNLPVKFEGYYPRFGAVFECRCYPTDEGLSLFIVDNTQTRKTLQRLRKSESELRRLAAVVEKCNDFVGICKPDGEPIYINQAGREIIGLQPDEDLSAAHFLQYFAPEDHMEMTHVGIPALKKYGRWKGAVRFKNLRTGEYIPTYWNVFAIKDPDGDLPEVWATVSPDLSEQQRMENVLRSSEQRALQASVAKSEFLANMSHEIRTPMAAILGYADLLLTHLDNADDRGCVLIMKQNGEHLLDLINDILDLSRIEAGKLDVDLHPVDLPQLLGEIEALMQVRAREKQLELVVRIEGSAPEIILTDAKRLRQILINLVGNAIKFTQAGSVQLIASYQPEPRPALLTFDVRDTGIGMTPQQLSRLFQPFTQGDSSVTRAYGGSGLGLAISKRLIEMLHGDISVSSQPGKGSLFSAHLPVEIPEDVVLEPLHIKRVAPELVLTAPRDLDCKVLIADDRRDVRFISQHFLEAAGACVVAVEDGRLAMDAVCAAIAQKEPFDIIVLDMQMPQMDGYQAAAAIRKLGCAQPIIALTADAMKGDRERCLLAGCDDYISKPIQQSQFVDIIARYTQDFDLEQLRRRRAEQVSSLRNPAASGRQ